MKPSDTSSCWCKNILQPHIRNAAHTGVVGKKGGGGTWGGRRLDGQIGDMMVVVVIVCVGGLGGRNQVHAFSQHTIGCSLCSLIGRLRRRRRPARRTNNRKQTAKPANTTHASASVLSETCQLASGRPNVYPAGPPGPRHTDTATHLRPDLLLTLKRNCVSIAW